jgi:nucleoid-associated protein YgaU
MKMAAQSALVGRVVLVLLGGATAAVVGYRVWLPDAAVTAPETTLTEQPLVVDPPVAAAPVSEVPVVEAPVAEAPVAETPVDEAPIADAPVAVASAEAPVVAPAAEPAPANPAPVAAADPVPEGDPAPVLPAPSPPGFDVVRIAPDGAALIAGSAPPDAHVSVLLDGVQETRVQADAAGQFVALFTLAPNPAPRILGLVAILADGSSLPGTETVAVAPIAAVAPQAAALPDAPATPVPPPSAPLLLTEDGASVLQSPQDVAVGEPVSVTLDAISYTADGAVQLAGHGQGGAVLRIYLDNAAIADARVADGGEWATTLPETAPGIYTLRIDQIGPDGAVTARTETPFKRETREALALAAGIGAVTEPDPAPAAAPEPAPEPAPAPDSAPVAPAPVAPAVVAPAPEPAPAPVAAVPAPPVTITVQPGFTLWGIATDMMGEGTMYVQVFEANKDKIRNPDLIYPGQVFTLPQE